MSTTVGSIVNLLAGLMHFMTATTTLFGRLRVPLLARTHILHYFFCINFFITVAKEYKALGCCAESGPQILTLTVTLHPLIFTLVTPIQVLLCGGSSQVVGWFKEALRPQWLDFYTTLNVNIPLSWSSFFCCQETPPFDTTKENDLQLQQPARQLYAWILYSIKIPTGVFTASRFDSANEDGFRVVSRMTLFLSLQPSSVKNDDNKKFALVPACGWDHVCLQLVTTHKMLKI